MSSVTTPASAPLLLGALPTIEDDELVESPASVGRLPFLVFCVYTFILLARPQDYFPALIPLRPALALTILTVVLTALWRRDGDFSLFEARGVKLYLGFYLMLLVGVPFSLYRARSFDFVVLEYSVNLVYFLLFVFHVRTIDRLKMVVFVVTLSAVLFSALGLQYGSNVGGRYAIAGSMFDPNDVAFVEVSLLSFALCVLVASFSRLARLVAVAAVLLGVLLALYTGSRGGLLGLASFLACFLLVRTAGVKARGKILILVVLIGAAMMNSDKINVDRYRTMMDLDKDYNNTEFGRVGIWQRGLQIFADRPVVGVGVGRFGQAIGTTRLEDNETPRWQTAHNSYVQILTETGVLGASTFLMLIIHAFAAFIRGKRLGTNPDDRDVRVIAGLLLVGFIAQLVAASFLSQAYSMFFTLVFAAATAIGGIASGGKLETPAPDWAPPVPAGTLLEGKRPGKGNVE